MTYDMFLLRKQNRETLASIDPIIFGIDKMLVSSEPDAKPNFLCEERLTSFLKTQVVRMSRITRVRDSNDTSLHIVGTIKMYVRAERLTGLVTFLVRERLAVPDIN